ncbi:MAG TPA: hypothetical protein DCQ98_09330 [Planctomycetaceae bacterium]|nr:hypothetical protein [Planctomycetaceae bacterium]
MRSRAMTDDVVDALRDDREPVKSDRRAAAVPGKRSGRDAVMLRTEREVEQVECRQRLDR